MRPAERKTLGELGALLLLFVILAVLGSLGGCSTVKLVPVNVPVPVACTEPEPARPTMPTERLKPGALLDDTLKHAFAEIDTREGYEGQLRTALRNCKKPLQPQPTKPVAAEHPQPQLPGDL